MKPSRIEGSASFLNNKIRGRGETTDLHSLKKEPEAGSYQQENPIPFKTVCSWPEENTMLWETNNLTLPDIWVGTTLCFLYHYVFQLGHV